MEAREQFNSLQSQRKLPSRTVIEESAALQYISSNQNEETLWSKSGSHCPGRVERDNGCDDLNRINITGVFFMAGRLHIGYINDWESQFLRRLLINACIRRPSVDKRQPGLWHGQALALRD